MAISHDGCIEEALCPEIVSLRNLFGRVMQQTWAPAFMASWEHLLKRLLVMVFRNRTSSYEGSIPHSTKYWAYTMRGRLLALCPAGVASGSIGLAAVCYRMLDLMVLTSSNSEGFFR